MYCILCFYFMDCSKRVKYTKYTVTDSSVDDKPFMYHVYWNVCSEIVN